MQILCHISNIMDIEEKRRNWQKNIQLFVLIQIFESKKLNRSALPINA